MAIVRKYNKTTELWEPVASGDATGIFTNNPILTGDASAGVKSVEEVLLRDREDIELLRKNVSWLAEHGGGGSGSGSGSYDFSVSFLDIEAQSLEISSIIWSNDITTLYYVIDSKGSSKYTVQVLLDGKQVYYENNVKKGVTKTIPTSVLKITKDAVLQVIAYDESETAVRANLSIMVASVTIDYCTFKCTIEQLESSLNYLELSYYTSISGDYWLYWDETPITRDSDGNVLHDGKISEQRFLINGVVAGQNVYRVNILELNIETNTQPGIYPRYFMLVKTDNNYVVSSSQAAQINIITTDGILASVLNITSEDNPLRVTEEQNFNVRFLVLSGINTTNTYEYEVTCDGVSLTEGWIGNNLLNQEISYSILPNAKNLVIGQHTLVLTVRMGAISDSKNIYIDVRKASAGFIQAYETSIQKNLIYEYTFWKTGQVSSEVLTSKNDEYQPSTYRDPISVESTMRFYNIGSDSTSDAGSMNFRHLAYANIDINKTKIFPSNSSDIESLIHGASDTFTLELAYTIGSETSDYATIFKLGDYDPVTNPTGHGIVIRAHDYYCVFGGAMFSGELQDNTFNQIDITYLRKNGERYIYVYLNGKALKAVKCNGAFDLYTANRAYVAYNGSLDDINTYSIDVDIHSIRLFESALNVGQIVCSYINNYASAHRLSDNSINEALITQLLNNNGINSDDLVAEGNDICSIYDLSRGEYTWDIVVTGSGAIQLPEQIRKLPIPKVVITVDWTYDQFRGQNLPTSQNGLFAYYPEGDSTPITGYVDVDPQGTTSSTYEIKNIDITYRNDYLFSPKSSWFPEGKHTLKADVVDSGHLNNAVIGGFINECFNTSSNNLLEIDNVFPAKGIIENLKANNQLSSDLTMKITVEGFPVLLILNFVGDAGTRDVRVLGIYSFNLGRDSVYNQGFIIPKHLYSTTGEVLGTNVVMPGFFGTPPANDIDTTYTAYCFEGQRSINNTVDEVALTENSYDYAIIISDNGEKFRYSTIGQSGGYVTVGSSRLLDSDNNSILYDAAHVQKYIINPNGYFWSDDSSFATSVFDAKYTGGNPTEAWNDFESFAEFVATGLNYNKGGYIVGYGSSLPKWYFDGNVESTTLGIRQGQNVRVDRPQAAEAPPFSVTNTAFYYVVAMLFGLVDNFGKNMQFKKWRNRTGSSSSTKWTPAFYDLDTALKLSNVGEETIPPTVFDVSFVNDADGRLTTVFGAAEQSDDSVVTVYSNKLFGFDNNDFANSYSVPGAYYNFFSAMWNDLRKYYLHDVEDFMDKYFNLQLKDCGELIMNYDYNVKYLNTNQISYLHGDRLGTIKNWLSERVVFLDSVFGYKARTETGLINSFLTDGIYNTPWINQVKLTHNSGTREINITFNKSLIERSRIGASSTYYTYVKKNVPVPIYVAESLNTKDIQTLINNSDCIIDISGLQSLNLTNLQSVAIGTVKDANGNNVAGDFKQEGTLSGLKTFDLTNVTTLQNGIDFSTLFKTWDTTPFDKTPEPFALKTVRLRNTKVVGNATLNVDFRVTNSHYTEINPFKNIVEVDVRNSGASSVTLPTGVSLYNLSIDNSNVTSVSLEKQPLIKSISFSGCNRLQEVNLINLPEITAVSFDSTNTNLRNITIAGCDKLSTVTIVAKSYTQMPTVSIQNCPALTSVTISEWNPPGNPTSTNTLTLTNNPNLKTVSIPYCKFSKVICDSDLTAIDMSYSSVSAFGKTSDVSTIDLSGYNRNLNVNLLSNTYVQQIDFGDTPFITTRNQQFARCTALIKLTGKLHIKHPNTFSNCSKLQEINGLSELRFKATDMSGIFSGTSCTHEEAIFVFTNCIESEMNQNFSSLFANSKVKWGTNAPIPKDLFKNCSKVTRLDSLFLGCGSDGYYTIPSPTKNGDKFNNDGLFTPLEKCTSLSYALSGSYIVDKYVFAHSRANVLTDITNFRPYLICPDANDFKIPNTTNILFDYTTMLNTYGDIGGMFKYLGELTSLSMVLMNTQYINWNSIKTENLGLKVTQNCTVSGCFRSDYAYGEFDLNNVFYSATYKSSIMHFYNSFTASANSIGGVPVEATFTITNDTFSGFSNLQTIGYIATGSAGIGNNLPYGSNTSFGGFKKIITSYPHNLLQNCKKLTSFVGFFYDCEIQDAESVQLPGDLFNNLTQLKNVEYTFYDFKTPYTLTSNGFKDCIDLQNVRYLFAASSFEKHKLTGEVPYKLFFHGYTTPTVVVTGSNSKPQNITVNSIGESSAQRTETNTIMDEDKRVTVTDTWTYTGFNILDNYTISITPESNVTHVKETVTEYTDGTSNVTTENVAVPRNWYETKTFTYTAKIPRATITNMENCFGWADISPVNTNHDDIEEIIYNDYNPFEYLYKDNKWSHPGPNLVMRSKIWGFSGDINNRNYIELDDTTNSSGYIEKYETVPDTIRNENGTLPSPIEDFWTETSVKNTGNYIASPDLFLYCAPNTNVVGLFKNCGPDGNSRQYMDITTPFGIYGRLCPYMLRPINRTTDFRNMFENCRGINGFVDNTGVKWIIPPSFFSYLEPNELNVNMEYMFAGLMIPEGASLDVFKADTTGRRSFNLAYIFYRLGTVKSSSVSTTTIIGDVFNDDKIYANTLMSAFDLGAHFATTDRIYHSLDIKFENVFKNFNKTSAKNDQYVFYGYNSMTDRFTNCGPREDASLYNYTAWAN